MSPEKLTVRAPAKINLFLEVMGKRPDGYHEVRSVIVPISIYDVLTLETTDGPVETTIRSAGIPCGSPQRLPCSESNLATKAAIALKKVTGYRGGARICIEKGIPIAAGLGGGSADAAATLVGLNKLWNTRLGIDDLVDLGHTLGSDVPALVRGGPVLIRGMGERVEPIEVGRRGKNGEWWLVVANPGFGVSTRDICTRFKSDLTTASGEAICINSALAEWNIEVAARSLFNSLEKTVFGKYPLLAMIADGLRESGALGVLLCGSGASVFGLSGDEEHARNIEKNIGRAMGTWLWTRIARVLPDGVTVAHGPLEARV